MKNLLNKAGRIAMAGATGAFYGVGNLDTIVITGVVGIIAGAKSGDTATGTKAATTTLAVMTGLHAVANMAAKAVEIQGEEINKTED